mmetsp:Transcript_48158/g.48556  ORF Transcript_48158/g.48556 Transcript_48158/m.48556 type:complete len:100 (-) Transcript_48158:537-836(-)
MYNTAISLLLRNLQDNKLKKFHTKVKNRHSGVRFGFGTEIGKGISVDARAQLSLLFVRESPGKKEKLSITDSLLHNLLDMLRPECVLIIGLLLYEIGIF